MKRYPKRARPLWGTPKRKAPVRYVYGPTTVTVRGLDIDGNEVVESSEWPTGSVSWTSRAQFASLTAPIVFTQSKMRADLKIKVAFSSGPALPGEVDAVAASFATAGEVVAAINAPNVNIEPGTVFVLPPVEVRP